jgi:hypothetical protein
MKKLVSKVGIASLALPTWVAAHDGHGLPGSHWHATDVWGFAAAAGVIALAVWLSRGGK